MKTLPLVRQYHPDITNTDLDIYKIENKVFAAPIDSHPDPFQRMQQRRMAIPILRYRMNKN